MSIRQCQSGENGIHCIPWLCFWLSVSPPAPLALDGKMAEVARGLQREPVVGWSSLWGGFLSYCLGFETR